MIRLRRAAPDLLAIALLVALWLLFFWRLFTPVAADQASLRLGDFSGQFVTFGGYQASRMCAGEWPLWNPYNNAGLPFAADTQAAVFYPPRWVTIAAACAGGWSYHALELEMTAHVLFASLAMYALARRLTLRSPVTTPAALVASLVFAYGGFLSGYPPLQLALLEAGVWLPLGILALTEATRNSRPAWRWLLVAAMALGLSWLAGHPQTSYFLSLLMAAYLLYRAWVQRWRWTHALLAVGLLAALSTALAAVLLLPGLEYLPRTARPGLGYDAKGNGFPFHDLLQMVFPGVLTVFSPLYAGFAALMLAGVALWRRAPGAWFWGIIALVALVWSLGANSPAYPLLYNALPGLRFFRGQERAAFLVAGSLSILAALGVAALPALISTHAARTLRRALWAIAALAGITLAFVFAGWLGSPDDYANALPAIAFSALMVLAAALIIPWLIARPRRALAFALLPLLAAFELFTVNMDAESTYDRTPPPGQIALTAAGNPLLAPILEDDGVFRVDGLRGLTDNYGSLWAIQDIQGISPLFLANLRDLLDGDLPDARLWEILAVRYVLSDWQELPVASDIVAGGSDRFGPVNAHRLADPRPFALLMPSYHVADNADQARTLLADPALDLRDVLILETNPGLSGPPGVGTAEIVHFAPEEIRIQVSADSAALLSAALLDYPGWQAEIDGMRVDILRAYSALSAVIVPEGEHLVTFRFAPTSVTAGAAISGAAWLGTLSITLVLFIMEWRRRAGS
ncbi:MAG: hypothetical protein JNL34_01220 [Anaerolineae bacterium]|nr:hypothetical protein [Anaerolineae bacterium]